MPWLTHPTSFQYAQNARLVSQRSNAIGSQLPVYMMTQDPSPPHSQHPNFGHLTLLVFEAVLEVVCVSLPGYIVARQGLFDASAQKFVANLNVMLFTPCLSTPKIVGMWFCANMVECSLDEAGVTTYSGETRRPCHHPGHLHNSDSGVVSLFCDRLKMLQIQKKASKLYRCDGCKSGITICDIGAERVQVFGNSNSLPISLVISLSHTISGLHWDKIPGDNDNEVGARGILYLLIFQQLGQLLRWSWGYNVLLKPADKYTEDEGGTFNPQVLESGRGRYTDDPDDELDRTQISAMHDGEGGIHDEDQSEGVGHGNGARRIEDELDLQDPISYAYCPSEPSPTLESQGRLPENAIKDRSNGNAMLPQNANLTTFPNVENNEAEFPGKGLKETIRKLTRRVTSPAVTAYTKVEDHSLKAFKRLPLPAQKFLSKLHALLARFINGLYEFMNPPLWAMLIAIVIASVPALQHLFFDDGTFIRNSVTRAVQQSGGVAVPLILVVLGANLARNTLPDNASEGVESKAEERNLLIAALVSRMLLPTIIMAPILAITAKYVPVSIVDDKIFIIVCFLLTGAPSALQLAQICQVNNVYMAVMSKLLFQSYVVWILPSTLALVLCALEVVEWAER